MGKQSMELHRFWNVKCHFMLWYWTFPLPYPQKLPVPWYKWYLGTFFFKNAVTMSPFCGATGTPSFRFRLTLPMGFKARVDAPFPVHNVTCTLWILRVNSGQGGAWTMNLSHDERTCYPFCQVGRVTFGDLVTVKLNHLVKVLKRMMLGEAKIYNYMTACLTRRKNWL